MHAEALSSPGSAALPRRRSVRALAAPTAWLAAMTYAAVLVLIPWAAIRGEPFFDLMVYLEAFDVGAYDYLDQLEGLAYLFSEPLWRTLVDGLASLIGDVPTTFHIISFVVSTVYAYVILRVKGSAAVFLAGPLLIDLVLSQVRSAVAGALFLIACLTGGALAWLVLLLVASLIHSAAVLLFALFGCAVALWRVSSRHERIAQVATLVASVAIPLALAAAYVGVLSSIGDRRAESEAAWPGGVFVATFAVYYAVMLLNLQRVMKRPVAIFSFLISGLFIVLAAHDINALRFISLTYPALILAVFVLPFLDRLLVMSALVVMCIYHFALWL
jgi:hypothetical protein